MLFKRQPLCPACLCYFSVRIKMMMNVTVAPFLAVQKKMHGAFGQEATGQNAHFLAQHSAHVARNLAFIFDEHLTFADQTSSLFKSHCYYNRQLFSMPPSLHYCHLRAIVHSNFIILYCYSL